MLDRPSKSEMSGAVVAAPLVLLPGTLCDGRVFAPVLSRIDRRGHVLPLSGADSAEAMAQLILAAAPGRFSLCGFSLGAIIALEIVAQAPERVERLALIGCNPGVLAPEVALNRATLTQDGFLRAEAGAHARLLAEMARDTPAEVYAQQTAITLSRRDSRGRLDQIDVPTLVLCGENDRTCPPSFSRAIAAAVPRAHLAIIEDAGHYVTLEQPDRVAAELQAWLARPAPTVH
jgi:pimeloyl-ACP methyl ester carboxylesterase